MRTERNGNAKWKRLDRGQFDRVRAESGIFRGEVYALALGSRGEVIEYLMN